MLSWEERQSNFNSLIPNSESIPSPVLERDSDAAQALRFPHSARRPALHALTGIRFFAALYVVLFYIQPFLKSRFQLHAGLERFLSNGNLAVAFFYMLSGFILAYTYEGKIENLRDYVRYLRARLARIYPVYLDLQNRRGHSTDETTADLSLLANSGGTELADGGDHAVSPVGIIGDNRKTQPLERLEQIAMRKPSGTMVVVFHDDPVDARH